MYLNKILSFSFLFSLLFLISCSSEIDQPQIVQPTPQLSTNSEFIQNYTHYTESLGAMKQALHKGKPGFENEIVQKYINLTNNPQSFKKTMDKAYILLNEKTIYEKWDLLQDKKIVNKKQHQYLYDYTKAIELAVEKSLPIEDLVRITTVSFEKENLKNQFNKNETEVLQLLGMDLMGSLLQTNYEPGTETRSCSNFLQKLACGIGTAGTIIVAAILVEEAGGLSMDNLEAICNLLDDLGINTNFVPEGYEELAQQLLGEGVPVDQINCAILVSVGVIDFIYQWCCTTVFGNDDPCSGVICPLGTFCDNGTCIEFPDYCEGVDCPEGTYCEGGVCYPWSCSFCQCEDDEICGTGFSCQNGICMPDN